MISIENLRASKALQAELLETEGVEVKLKDGNYWVSLDNYLWQPSGNAK